MRFLILLLAVAACGSAAGQETGCAAPGDSLAAYFRFDDPPPLACLTAWLPPLLIEHGLDLKDFIRSAEFRALRRRCGDRRAVDAIYVRAMQLTNNNTAAALLLCTLATFDHQLVGLRVPVFQLFFPLTDEDDREFALRVRALPRKLYDDTPPGKPGDRDKLQHFFGSAFFTVACESGDPAERIGEFVEQGEDAIIVGGVNDARDLRADRQGQRFGLALLDENRRLPSHFLTPVPRAAGSSVRDTQCCGVW